MEIHNTCLNDVQAALFLGLKSAQTLRNWRCLGKGPKYSKPGGRRVVYRVQDLEEFLMKNQIDPEKHYQCLKRTPAGNRSGCKVKVR